MGNNVVDLYQSRVWLCEEGVALNALVALLPPVAFRWEQSGGYCTVCVAGLQILGPPTGRVFLHAREVIPIRRSG